MNMSHTIKKLNLRKYLQRIGDISYAYSQINKSNVPDKELIGYYHDLLGEVQDVLDEYHEKKKALVIKD